MSRLKIKDISTKELKYQQIQPQKRPPPLTTSQDEPVELGGGGHKITNCSCQEFLDNINGQRDRVVKMRVRKWDLFTFVYISVFLIVNSYGIINKYYWFKRSLKDGYTIFL